MKKIVALLVVVILTIFSFFPSVHAAYATEIPLSNNFCKSGRGVDRCNSRNEMLGEAQIFCDAKVKETADAIKAQVLRVDAITSFTKWDKKNDKDFFGARSCKFEICFDCSATLKL